MVTKAITPRKGHPPHIPSPSKVECATEMEISHDVDTTFREELDRLAVANQQIIQRMSDSSGEINLSNDEAVREVEYLRSENNDLRSRLEEMEQLLQSNASARDWRERQCEYEALLDEKTEAIRTLHLRIQELQDLLSQATEPEKPASKDLNRKGLIEENEDVRRIKHELEDQRQQLEEDERSLMDQMRQMEMTMARERADMARQRSEITRLNTELAREIELASRDGVLRDRLAGLQRRHQEVTRGKPPTQSGPAAHAPAAPPKIEEEPKSNGGLFKRFFG